MKTTIYLFLTTLFTLNAFAQITVTQENFPKIGDTLNLAMDTTQVSFGTDGANQIWDFTMLENHGENSAIFIDPSGTPFASSFPNSNITFKSNDGDDQYVYLDKNEDGIFLLGVGNDDPSDSFILVFETPRAIFEFPFTYQDNFSQSTSDLIFQDTATLIGADSIRLYQKVQREVEIDGYGTVYLPNDTLESLRVREIEYLVDSTQVLFGGVWTNLSVERDTFITYSWYSDLIKVGWALVTISLNDPKDQTGSAQWYSNIPDQISSVPNIAKNNSISIYPNPASEYIFINFENNIENNLRLKLYDIKGQLVRTYSFNQQNNKINLNGISKGIYVYTIEKTGNIPFHYGKLTIQ